MNTTHTLTVAAGSQDHVDSLIEGRGLDSVWRIEPRRIPTPKTSDEPNDSLKTLNMNSLSYSVLTAPGTASVACFQLEGQAAFDCIGVHFHGAVEVPDPWPIQRVFFGKWRLGEDLEEGFEEEVVLCRLGEHRFEIHCHGGTAVVGALTATLQRFGCECVPAQIASTGLELSPTVRDAWSQLPRAATTKTAGILLAQCRGAMHDAVESLRSLASDGQWQAAIAGCRDLLATARRGLHLTTPFQVVVAGPANVGKSSLVNRLLGYARSLTSEQAGTTRDVLESDAVCDGFPVVLRDVAGWRSDSIDPVEREGVLRAELAIEVADLVVELQDASAAPQVIPVLESVESSRRLRVANKSDLGRDCAYDESWISVSAETGAGIPALSAAIARHLIGELFSETEPHVFTDQQVICLKRFEKMVAARNSRLAQESLRPLVDATTTL